MSKIKFHKLTGAGNDFIFIDLNENQNLSINSELVKKLCDRRFGIGADGLILISDIPDYCFRMDYYNSDGSKGSLCGNGARCAIWYSKLSGRCKNDFVNFLCEAKEYRGEIINDELTKFYLKTPSEVKLNFRVKANNQLIKASFINTGSPHLIINIIDVLKDRNVTNSFYQTLNDFPVLDLGKELRYHHDFSPNGTNVNFYHETENEIILRTYERGVENETLACGTGSVATAILVFLESKKNPPIKIKTWGGDTLIVNFELENKRIINLSLTGPAKLVFSGEILI